MTNKLAELRKALDAVPAILLDDELSRGLEDAYAAVDALAQFEPDPTIVIVSGPAGSGKSTLVNALVGDDVVPVSPVRPTTTAITAIANAETVRLAEATEFVDTDALPPGIVVVDTPPWDRAADLIASIMDRAALTIIVVTPTRYGDRTTSEALAAASGARQVKLIANRLPESDAEREQIEDAIHERLNVAPSDVFTEGSEIRFEVSPLAMLDKDDGTDERRRVLATAVAGSGRRIATGITASVRLLATVEHTIATIDAPTPDLGGIRIGTWEECRTELVRLVLGMVDDVDRSIERAADNDVALRIRRFLGPVDAEPIVQDLETWRSRTVSACVEAASPRLRKKSTIALVERHAWAVAVDPQIVTPGRFGRLARRKLARQIDTARTELVELLTGATAARMARWTDLVDGAGAYRPGALLAAANAVGGEAVADG